MPINFFSLKTISLCAFVALSATILYQHLTIGKLQSDLALCTTKYENEKQARLRDVNLLEQTILDTNDKYAKLSQASEELNRKTHELIESHEKSIIKSNKQIQEYKAKLQNMKKVDTCEDGFKLLQHELGER